LVEHGAAPDSISEIFTVIPKPREAPVKALRADFNDFAQSGDLPLTGAESRKSIAELTEPLADEERVWLTDGELFVIAQVFDEHAGTIVAETGSASESDRMSASNRTAIDDDEETGTLLTFDFFSGKVKSQQRPRLGPGEQSPGATRPADALDLRGVSRSNEGTPRGTRARRTSHGVVDRSIR